MTPKEKAKELVDKMYGDELDYVTEGQAKQCALIAVDEMINILIMVFDNDDTKAESYDFMDKRIKYLEEVKQEIINL